MIAAITWDWDPILLNLGPLQIRYYGVMFALTIYTGFAVWRRQALRIEAQHLKELRSPLRARPYHASDAAALTGLYNASAASTPRLSQ